MICRHQTALLKSLQGPTRRVGCHRVSQASAASSNAVPTVVLKGGKAGLFVKGHPIVFGQAVDCVIGKPPMAGDSVIVTDGSRKAVGWGMFNPDSLFRVRMLQLESEGSSQAAASDLRGLLKRRIQAAVDLRTSLGLPSPATNVYRLLNSEGDRLSGLTVDVLGESLVVSSSAAWVERHRHLIEELLQSATGLSKVKWRPVVGFLREEGLEVPEQQPSPEMEAAEAEVFEGGVRYLAQPFGQKTGFYADQRDSRSLIGRLAKGKTVLDLCCYSGGFALCAAVGGATDVIGVDSSAPAISLATRNLTLNSLNPSTCRFVKADILDFIRESREAPPGGLQAAFGGQERGKKVVLSRQWDIVILDPPKLAPKRNGLQRALIAYKRLNVAALKVVVPGGLLMTCSCSGAVAQTHSLLPVVREAALAAGRQVTLLRVSGPGLDHPLDPAYPEGNYLTNLLFRVL